MPRDGKIMAGALRRFQAAKDRRAALLESRTEEVHRRVPALEALDRRLQGTAAQIVLAAFSDGGDPEAALKRLAEENLALQRERAELLVGAGYPYDYLDDGPACPICQDRGFLPDGALCQCLAACYTQEQNRRLSKMLDLGNQSFGTFSLSWYSPEPWEGYGRSPLDNMKMALELCQSYARSFPELGNLLFTGAPGLGKTFLSAAIAREVSAEGFSVVYDTAVHIFERFEARKFGREAGETVDADVDRVLDCGLLILDDLGTEMTTPFIQSALYSIVNGRIINRRPTILSTNLKLEDLARRYTPQIVSRLEGEYQILPFFGEDIRRLKKERG